MTTPSAVMRLACSRARPGLCSPSVARYSRNSFQYARCNGQIETPLLRRQSTSSNFQSFQQLPLPPAPPRFRVLRFIGAAVFYSSVGFVIGIMTKNTTVIEEISGILKPPTDEETLSLFHPEQDSHAEVVEAYIQSHPLTKSLYDDPHFIPSRPLMKIPPPLRPLNLTAGTLLGERKVEVPPLQFSTRDGSSYISIQYLGEALCGHPGIIHGGLLATLLDEGLARCCFPALPNKVAVTASLSIDYRAPCKAKQYVVLRAETQKVEGRKAWVTGWIQPLPSPEEWEAEGLDGKQKADPVKLVEAQALFIEPKGVAKMLRAYAAPADSATSSRPPTPPTAG